MTRSRKKRIDKSGDGRARPGRRPTIREVSRLAGVSHMTVSRVIRDLDLVQPETRARVHKAIADLGYVPDRAAGSLASRRTGFIALMLPSLTNTNFAAVAHGLTDALRLADYDLLIAYTEYSVSEEERQLKNLLARARSCHPVYRGPTIPAQLAPRGLAYSPNMIDSAQTTHTRVRQQQSIADATPRIAVFSANLHNFPRSW